MPGRSLALIRAVEGIIDAKLANHGQDVGPGIARRAMEEPLRQIVDNAGPEALVALHKVEAGEGNYVYDASIGEYGDMVGLGILDPTKVTRSALYNATSIAGLMVTTEAMVAEELKEQSAPAGGGMGDMGGTASVGGRT